MRRSLCTIAFLALLLCCIGCSAKRETRTLLALDTVVEMHAYGRNAAEALQICEAELRYLESLFSVTDASSDVDRLNEANGEPLPVSDETAALLAEAIAYSEQTGGTFDPTIYPLMRLWGFSDTPAVPDESEIDALLGRVGVKSIRLDGTTVMLENGVGIDLGGIAKGYISDRLTALLRACGIEHAFLTLGGNVHVIGTKRDGNDWQIGLQDPNEPNGVLGVIAAKDTAIITSGSYQRYFEENGVRYHHILDPKTGHPADSDLLSVTIICENGTKADALSTALFVMGSADAIAFWREYGGFEWVMVKTDGTILCSEGARFSPTDEREIARVSR